MKTMMVKLISFLLILCSPATFADKILITGKPVMLIPDVNYYTFPHDYSPTSNYHFVHLAGDNRVCFLYVKPELASLDLLRIYIIQNGKKYRWYCYRYDSRFFSINF